MQAVRQEAVRSVAQMSVRPAVPTRVYAQGDVLYVHTGAQYRVVGRIGELGKVAVSGSYPKGAFAERDMRWAEDKAGVASYVATAVNAYPVLSRNVARLEARNAELEAKVKMLREVLQRAGNLSPEYVQSLTRELDACLGQGR